MNSPITPAPAENPLNERLYARYMNALEVVKSRFSVRLRVTQEGNALEQGDIFLFNHFTRMETTIPPYVIYKQTGKMVRSVATSGLFRINEHFTRHLGQAGAVPTNMPGLLPFLAKEILRGRKVVIFPEGGMVSDKKVLDEHGNYVFYSDKQGKNRRHHKGAAALAVTLDIIKHHLRVLLARQDAGALGQWCASLGLPREELARAVEKPTLLVPGTITFYPLRADENNLIRNIEKYVGKLPPRAFAELVMESNLLLNDTDMYLHFGTPQRALEDLGWGEKMLINHALSDIRSVDALFERHEEAPGWSGLYYKRFVEKNTERVRTDYARNIYRGLAVNFNHVMAVAVSQLVAQGQTSIGKGHFHKVLYLALKSLQRQKGLNLHCTLTRPSSYNGLLNGQSKSFQGFLKACKAAGLMWEEGASYALSPHTNTLVHGYHTMRLENPVRLHANEIAPIKEVAQAVEAALKASLDADEKSIAAQLFEDELAEYESQRARWAKKMPQTLLPESETHSGKPYLLLPEKPARVGVLLVHGFGAMPSGMRPLAGHLHQHGYAVLGMRLPGHGTAWPDMEGRTRQEWLTAVAANARILAAHVEKVIVVGSSTGGALALQHAATQPEKLAGVLAAAPPFYVQDKNIHLLPLVMAARKALGWLPPVGRLLGSYGFGNTPDPGKYARVPTAALNELRLLTAELKKSLPQVQAPVLILQGTADETVQPRSAETVHKLLGSPHKHLVWIPNGPHALIAGNVGPTWKEIKKFLRAAGGLL